MATSLSISERDALAHWSMYGQGGSTPKQRVMSDWMTKPFVKPITSLWDIKIRSDLLPILLPGFRPRKMEDKWFIHADGPNTAGHATLHFHRSWTGAKIAEIGLEISSEDQAGPERPAQITKILWESSEETVRGASEQEAKETNREVCRRFSERGIVSVNSSLKLERNRDYIFNATTISPSEVKVVPVEQPDGLQKPTLYILSEFHTDIVAHTQSLFNCFLPDSPKAANWRSHATAILIKDYCITAEDLAAAPQLRVIGNQGVGIEKIDAEACARAGVRIFNSPGVNS